MQVEAIKDIAVIRPMLTGLSITDIKPANVALRLFGLYEKSVVTLQQHLRHMDYLGCHSGALLDQGGNGIKLASFPIASLCGQSSDDGDADVPLKVEFLPACQLYMPLTARSLQHIMLDLERTAGMRFIAPQVGYLTIFSLQKMKRVFGALEGNQYLV